MSAAAKQPHYLEDPGFTEFVRSCAFEPSYTKAGVCTVLQKSDRSVDRLVKSGQLRAFRVGPNLLFMGRDVAALLWRLQVEPEPRDNIPRQKPPHKRTPPDPAKGVEARRAKARGRRRVNPVHSVKLGARS